ncbi:hypothetical protein I9Y56_002513 [Providencia stuartii]
MSYDLMNIQRQLKLIEHQINVNAAANNFVIKHLIDIISEKLPNENITELLKENLEHDLSRIADPGINDVKKAINNLLQKPVKEAFSPQNAPFIK